MLEKLERIKHLMEDWGGVGLREAAGGYFDDVYKLVLELIELAKQIKQDEAENERLLEEAYRSAW